MNPDGMAFKIVLGWGGAMLGLIFVGSIAGVLWERWRNPRRRFFKIFRVTAPEIGSPNDLICLTPVVKRVLGELAQALDQALQEFTALRSVTVAMLVKQTHREILSFFRSERRELRRATRTRRAFKEARDLAAQFEFAVGERYEEHLPDDHPLKRLDQLWHGGEAESTM